jgi:hypothetical protein
MGKFPVSGAFRAAGLDRFADITHIPPEHTKPLVETNSGLAVTTPTPTPTPTESKQVKPAAPKQMYIG